MVRLGLVSKVYYLPIMIYRDKNRIRNIYLPISNHHSVPGGINIIIYLHRRQILPLLLIIIIIIAIISDPFHYPQWKWQFTDNETQKQFISNSLKKCHSKIDLTNHMPILLHFWKIKVKVWLGSNNTCARRNICFVTTSLL